MRSAYSLWDSPFILTLKTFKNLWFGSLRNKHVLLQTRELLSTAYTHLWSQFTTAICVKKRFSKSAKNWRSHIFATKRPTDKIKYFIETQFHSRFFSIFEVSYPCHIFVTKRPTYKIKYVLKTLHHFLFFIFVNIFNLNWDFRPKMRRDYSNRRQF